MDGFKLQGGNGGTLFSLVTRFGLNIVARHAANMRFMALVSWLERAPAPEDGGSPTLAFLSCGMPRNTSSTVLVSTLKVRLVTRTAIEVALFKLKHVLNDGWGPLTQA